ncbi:MAG: LysE family translocator [Bacteroidales bacterium]|nr:LysE family translocator [Bacteroidales bacterium]
MTDILQYLITGIIFGLTAGISPGPILTLVISETLRHNKKEGIKIAITPLISDIPIIALTMFVFSQFTNSDLILGMISILGGAFIAYLGYETIKVKSMDVDLGQNKPRSLRKGIIVNFLSPHPYLFWLVVGSPLLFKAYQATPVAAIAFVVSFYICLVGSKIIIAMLVDRSRSFLKNRAFLWTMRILGVALITFAVIFIIEGLEFFKIL